MNVDGATYSNSTGSGVNLGSGSSILAGDSVILVNGSRQWRLRLPSNKESAANVVVLEYKSGVKWIVGAAFDVPQ